MFQTFMEKLRLYWRKLWVRVVFIAILSVFAVLMARVLGPLLPEGMGQVIGADALDNLLDIMASSMLTVTTFSLSIMVSSQRAVSSQWTPRAHHIQLRDQSTQMVLATFVGAFIYALLSIILRATQFFNAGDTVILFGMTLIVNAIVVIMILRWIARLQSVGSLSDISNRVESLTVASFRERMKCPTFDAQELSDDMVIPLNAHTVRSEHSGYIERIFPAALQSAASDCDGIIYVTQPVGAHISRGDVIAHITSEKLKDAVTSYVKVGSMRDIEQDPGFGLQILAEIGSKALSPGINDVGTAIDMVDRMTRVLESWNEPQDHPDEPYSYDCIYIPRLNMRSVISPAFELLMRDGAGSFELQLSLQRRLHSLMDHPDPAVAQVAEDLSADAMTRTMQALPFDEDKTRLRHYVQRLTQTDAPLSETSN